jgi:hypothetical protein
MLLMAIKDREVGKKRRVAVLAPINHQGPLNVAIKAASFRQYGCPYQKIPLTAFSAKTAITVRRCKVITPCHLS